MNSVPDTRPGLHFARLWQSLGLLWLLSGLVLALVKMPEIEWTPNYFDKIEHALGFCLMMLYAGMLFPQGRRWAALGLLLYGIKIELLQMLVPWRGAEWLDLAADVLGILAAWLLLSTPLQRALALLDAGLALLWHRVLRSGR
ncbi:VanZ family protein [Pseudomarimonas arenosa]|uniref:VanZ family protein n=1 Tax=Pseudomarimonas arenosa TaxID=2774145 RepID=A0AAW3ZMB7_9GAMM|nr:VanZ family protein [Pseudomarimonas arenosa]MBD8525794.1 VanZ family protein [Pseudomarimonas arenosa]